MSGVGKEQSYLLSPRRRHLWERDKDELSDTHTCPLHLCCSWGPGALPWPSRIPAAHWTSPPPHMQRWRPRGQGREGTGLPHRRAGWSCHLLLEGLHSQVFTRTFHALGVW